MNMTRRSFLRTSAAVSLGFMGLATFTRHLAAAEAASDIGYGPLLPDPEGVLDLPAGFRYRVISRIGQHMDDGLLTPGLPDGMAAFPGPHGKTILVRNHEIRNAPARLGAFGWSRELADRVDPAKLYDPGHGRLPALGGTTTLVYDTRSHRLEKQFMSLAGTRRNCAGGPTPWGSWITCEEDVTRADDENEKDHGYNFEVPASADSGLVDPVPLKAMGRFNHEAVAVDPHTGIVYQTEDRHEGLIYRFIPNKKGELAAGGRLQAMTILDRPSCDTRNWIDQDTQAQSAARFSGDRIEPGTVLRVGWMDLEEIDAPEDDLRLRGFEAGAARFARGEGMWYGRKSIYFACTNGGANRKGQIWRYVPSRFEATPDERRFPGMLELFVEPNDHDLCENADNICVAPWGDLIVAEDAGDRSDIVGITPQGGFYKLASNVLDASELAGVTFSPDGSTLFFNQQITGITYAVTGPWQRQG